MTWPVDATRAQVRCYNAAGCVISCCGHGLLSCANLWLNSWPDAQPDSPDELATFCAQGTLLLENTEIPCLRRDGLVWIGLPPIALQYCATPSWLAAAIGATTIPSAAIDCATAGDENGYLVARLPADTDLTALSPPGDALTKHSQRALIVACDVSPTQALLDETIHLRYFAPQYGEVEDTATGSAMRVLARCWQRDTATLTALQRSARGGYLRSELAHARIWVGGYVTSTVIQDSL